jgi:proteasome lid subunit RPN8/RPN11
MIVNGVVGPPISTVFKSKSKDVSGRKGQRSRRKRTLETKVLIEKMVAETSKLDSLALEIQTLNSTVSFLQSESNRLSDNSRSLESQLGDLKDYFEKRIQDIAQNIADFDSKIEETRISFERLSRDFDRLVEGQLPIRKIAMPPPITSQLTIYRGEESLAFQLGVVPGIIDEIMERARSHTNQRDKPDEEVVGVLTGRVVGNTVIAEEALQGRVSYAGSTEVALDPQHLAEIVEKIMNDGKNQRIVGWYHSHLGLGAFLSDVDIRTQLILQQFSYVIALVADPIKDEYGFFYVDKEVKQPDGRPRIVRLVESE